MKFLGNNRTVSPRSGLSFSAYLGLGGAALLAVAVSISACIPAGDCTGECAEATAGGASGSGGGGGSQAGSGGGSGGAKSPPADLEVEGCAAHPTIADVESAVIVKTCGLSGCHSKASTLVSDLKTAGIAMRILNAKPKMICQDDKLIDSDAFEKSLILRKLEDAPKCNNGDDAGEKMPSSGSLSADDKTCLVNYVKAIAAWSKM